MALNQDFAGSEHTAAGSRFKTDLHGIVEYAVKIAGPTTQVKVTAVKVLGSAFEVAQSLPDGEELPTLELTIRYSGLVAWEKAFRDQFSLADTDIVAIGAYPLTCSIVSAPFDEQNNPLPSTVITFPAKYLGFKVPDVDRKSSDSLEAMIYLKQTAPAVAA